MPLSVVAELLELPDDDASGRLNRWRATQKAAERARRGTLAHLRAQLLRTAAPQAAYTVTVRQIPAVKVATVRYDIDQQGLVAAIGTGEQLLRRHPAAAGVPNGRPQVLYHGMVTPDSEAGIEACMPFAGTVNPARDMAVRIEPAHTQAWTAVLPDDCCHPQILAAYTTVTEHAQQARLHQAGPWRKENPHNWDDISGADVHAQVALPVRGDLP